MLLSFVEILSKIKNITIEHSKQNVPYSQYQLKILTNVIEILKHGKHLIMIYLSMIEIDLIILI